LLAGRHKGRGPFNSNALLLPGKRAAISGALSETVPKSCDSPRKFPALSYLVQQHRGRCFSASLVDFRAANHFRRASSDEMLIECSVAFSGTSMVPFHRHLSASIGHGRAIGKLPASGSGVP